LGKGGEKQKKHDFSLLQQPNTNRIGQAGQRDLSEKGKEKKTYHDCDRSSQRTAAQLLLLLLLLACFTKPKKFEREKKP
jgi:hypothetical protein